MQVKGSIRDILVVPLRAFSGAQRRSLLTGRCLVWYSAANTCTELRCFIRDMAKGSKKLEEIKKNRQ